MAWWYLMDIAQWHFADLDITWKISSDIPAVGLTIDDVVYGPSFEGILDVLEKFGAKATFFVIGSYVNDENRHLLIRAIHSGHHLANHGYVNTMHALYSEKELETEIKRCEEVLKGLYQEANVAYPTRNYFRPGVGYTTRTIERVCHNLNYQIVLGTVYPSDPKLPFPSVLAYYVNSKVKANDIIILHDRSWTPTTLSLILPKISEKFAVKPLYEAA